MRSIGNFIKSHDYFGESIVFTFNKEQDNVHRTLFGGVVSLVIKILMFVYVVFLVNMMVTFGNDTNKQYSSIFDYINNQLQAYNFNDTSIFFYVQIFDIDSKDYLLMS